MKKIALATIATLAAMPAFANTDPLTVSVPEISALDGAAALAVIAAFVLIAWERRRKAA